MATTCRTWEEVTAAADAAGLSSRTGITQVLKFSEGLMNEEYKLLELSAGILDSFQNGERVVIRGDARDDAVLCTENETFDLKLADTSNTILLTPDTLLPQTADFDSSEGMKESKVCGCVSFYYELRHRRPKLQKLNMLLQGTAYRGESFEKQIMNGHFKKYTLNALCDKVQASDSELLDGLKQLNAFEFDGFWRILEKDYEEKAVVAILRLLDENSWRYDCVPLKKTCDVLEELIPRFVISHCMRCYGEEVSMETDEGSGEIYYKFSEDKVCRFYAENLLQRAERFDYSEFMESWERSVPEGMNINDSHLEGLALTDMTSHPPSISYFPKENLPADPALRFNKLFKARQKWTLEEIQPYLADLESTGQSINALLLKFARCSTDACGKKVYNSKRPLK